MREKLAILKHKPRSTISSQTAETSKRLDDHFKLVKTVYQESQDLIPIWQKSLGDVKINNEFYFDPNTLVNIHKETEIGSSLEDESDLTQSRSRSGERQNEVALPVEKVEKIEKKWSMSGLLRKISDSLGDQKRGLISFSADSNNLNSAILKTDDADSVKKARDWEKEVFLHLDQGQPFKQLEDKIVSLIMAGNSPPSYLRGRLWIKALGNRSRINRRLFKLLYSQLDSASPLVKDSIVKDMDRTYSEFKISNTFIHIRAEATKILQLWDIHRPDIGFIQGMSYIAVLLRLKHEQL